MFGIGTTEIIVILVVALLVLGPKKLPEMARSLGKTLAEFKRVTTDVKRTIDIEMDREEEIRAKKKIRQEMEQKASTESTDSDRDSSNDYPEQEAADKSESSVSEPDRKSGAA